MSIDEQKANAVRRIVGQQGYDGPRCRWREEEDGWYTTECYEAFEFTKYGPDENRVRFCPFCGRGITLTTERKAGK